MFDLFLLVFPQINRNMKNLVQVTIGIPIYNAEEYIERCLYSTLEQTFEDLEILLVDDCGTDDSMLVAQRIAKEHPRGNCIRIVKHEKNMGVANARNTIVSEARGKYLYFMDSDDKVTDNVISLLYEKAERYNAETVWGSYQSFANNPKLERILQYPDMLLLGEDKLAEYECQDWKEHLQQAVWNILFRTDFLRMSGIKFEQHGSLDDLIFHYRIQPLVKRAVLVSDITYLYYIRDNSISNFQSRTSFSRFEAINAIQTAECLKDSCKSLVLKSYYDCRCTKAMRQSFFYCYGILHHRNMMDQNVSDKEIRDIMKHPATLWQIMHFKRYIAINLFFYLLGIMPSHLMVAIVNLISKRRGYT